MRCRTVIDPEREEQVLIFAREKTELVKAIEDLCREEPPLLIGYRDKEGIPLSPGDVHCFTVEENRVYALTETEKLQMKQRLYQLEGSLPDHFVKINQSTIANLRKIRKFDVSMAGTMKVLFQNGTWDFVSRRNLKQVKERLGLK